MRDREFRTWIQFPRCEECDSGGNTTSIGAFGSQAEAEAELRRIADPGGYYGVTVLSKHKRKRKWVSRYRADASGELLPVDKMPYEDDPTQRLATERMMAQFPHLFAASVASVAVTAPPPVVSVGVSFEVVSINVGL